ncbi:hypothetical protein [Anaeroselena agilis]|uniref:TPM domain-containing protein n=1 Tax=Anaeroselena agilis TaxID=3063788 RepID=A0ABU3NXT5_9FIRM|nr:hypothetical protein [Selenomonadales bacterium 4137-cl]
MRILIIAAVVLVLVFSAGMTASANPAEGAAEQGKVSVIVFLDKLYREDTKCMDIITKGLEKRFGADNVAIFGGSSAKSPAFMEFVESIQSYPANEKAVLVVPDKFFYKYGEDTGASHVVFVVISSGEYDRGGWDARQKTRVKTDITVFSVKAKKVLMNKIVDTGEKLLPFRESIQLAADQLQSDFKWTPADAEKIRPAPVNSISVLTFLPRAVMDKSELFSAVTKAITEKMRDADITNYGDYQSKSPEYMEFIVKVVDDSARQKALVVKKEHLLQFGKDSGYRTVVLFRMYYSDKGNSFGGATYRVKNDITVLSVDSGKYLGNFIFDTEKQVSLAEAIELLTAKFKAGFRMPVAAYSTGSE